MKSLIHLILRFCLLTGIAVLTACTTTATHPKLNAEQNLPQLIPVRDFVANIDSNWGYVISPDGKKLAWLAIQGLASHIFVKDLEHNTTRSFAINNFYGGVTWAQDSRRLILPWAQGDENTSYYIMDTESAEKKPEFKAISPLGSVKAQLVSLIASDAKHVLIAHNRRDKTLFDLYKIDITNGHETLLAQNPGDTSSVLVDSTGQVRGYIVIQDNDYSIQLLQADSTLRKTVYRWNSSDSVYFVSFADDGKQLFLFSNKNRDKIALIAIDTESNIEKLIYQDPSVDLSTFYTHPITGKPLIVFSDPDYPKAVLLDPAMHEAFSFLQNKEPTRFNILSSDQAFQQLTLATSTDKGTTWYLYDVAQNHLEKLGASPSLEFKDALADMRPVTITSRDGLSLHGYLTLPQGIKPKGLPMVLWVHGGPWWRTTWQYNSEIQLLANRGYAVLQINFRGSTGYGRHFEELAIGEFAGKMQDDLLDAVNWAIAQGIADPEKIAIMGGSYGGYATLVGMTATPETFACGIDIFGPTDLEKLIRDFPPYWKFEMARWYRYVGDPDKPADQLVMRNKSPLFQTDNIVKPLLVVQGGWDVRVKADQSTALVDKLRQADKAVDYWLEPNMGHGVVHWPHRLKLFRKTEDFLAECLGGRSSNFDYYQLGSWLF